MLKGLRVIYGFQPATRLCPGSCSDLCLSAICAIQPNHSAGKLHNQVELGYLLTDPQSDGFKGRTDNDRGLRIRRSHLAQFVGGDTVCQVMQESDSPGKVGVIESSHEVGRNSVTPLCTISA